MTLSGTALFIGYLCLGIVFKKSMTQCMRYRELKIVLLTYVIPWVWLKEPYKRFLGIFWREEAAVKVTGFVDIAEIATKEEAYLTKGYVGLVMFMLIWFLGAISLVAIKSVRHLKRCHDFRVLSIECPDEKLDETVRRLQKELRCRRKPDVVWTRVDNETFTLRVLRPVIYLQKDYEPEELYLILKHEMIHIVRGDLLIKLLMEFTACLHWVNPFVHMLINEMHFVCEASCDECVVKGSTDEERRSYIGILDENKHSDKLKISVSNGLEGNDDDVEDRIKLIYEEKPIERRKKAFAISIFALLVFLDSLTALAYPKIRHVKITGTETAKEVVGGSNLVMFEYSEEGYDVNTSPILYDEQFVTDTGQIYPVNPEELAEFCADHVVESGYFQKHIKNDDNSCMVETYEGNRCTICGKIEIGDLSLTSEYDACIH